MFIVLYEGGYETCKYKSEINTIVNDLHLRCLFEDPSELIVYELGKAYRIEEEYKVIPL